MSQMMSRIKKKKKTTIIFILFVFFQGGCLSIAENNIINRFSELIENGFSTAQY